MRRALDGNPRITTTFLYPGMGSLGKHLGYDYGVAIGTPVKAPVSGVVRERVETSGSGSGGKRLEIAGDDGRWHRLLHLNAWHVKVGDRVAEGQHVADSGATGDVTGPHLHHDVRKAGTAWNASLSNYFDWEQIISQPVKKTNEQIADEVLAGKWGNGDDRKKRLQAAGYDYNAIQAIINNRLNPAPKPTPTPPTSKVPKQIYLKPTVSAYAFYRPGTPLPVKRANRAGELNPKKWGGITYNVIRQVAANTYEVKSPSLGIIWVWAGDNDSEKRY